jgi:hypothetical protein
MRAYPLPPLTSRTPLQGRLQSLKPSIQLSVGCAFEEGARQNAGLQLFAITARFGKQNTSTMGSAEEFIRI